MLWHNFVISKAQSHFCSHFHSPDQTVGLRPLWPWSEGSSWSWPMLETLAASFLSGVGPACLLLMTNVWKTIFVGALGVFPETGLTLLHNGLCLVTSLPLKTAAVFNSRSPAGKAVDMSYDHKPEDEVELARIKNAGGKVTMDGRVNGGLNLSRAIGTFTSWWDIPVLVVIIQVICVSPHSSKVTTSTRGTGLFLQKNKWSLRCLTSKFWR